MPRQMLLAATISTILGAAVCPAHAQSCEKDSLETVGRSGEILVMLSGAVYEVLAGDTIDSALWLPPSDVLICARAFTSREAVLSPITRS